MIKFLFTANHDRVPTPCLIHEYNNNYEGWAFVETQNRPDCTKKSIAIEYYNKFGRALIVDLTHKKHFSFGGHWEE